MDIRVNDRVLMKKQHPCGGREMLVLRTGMDFRLRCTTCGREFMTPRLKIEKYIRQIHRQESPEQQDGESNA